MREFFELVNEYPWTTFWLIIGLGFLIEKIGTCISEIIHGIPYEIKLKRDIKDNE